MITRIVLLALLASIMAAPAVAAPSDDTAFYVSQSETTSPGKHAELYRDLPRDPKELAQVVQGLLLHGSLGWMYQHQPSQEQFAGFTAARSAEQILDNVMRLDPSPLTVARPIDRRAVGNCRTFSVLMVSMLRHQGFPARMRVGYSTYTWGPPNLENHFIVEYFDGERWVLLDPQIDQVQREFHKIEFDTLDVPRDKFLVAGRVWKDLRGDKTSPDHVGMGGPDGWVPRGFQFAQVDLIADAWALNKVELFTGEGNALGLTPHEQLAKAQLDLFDVLAELTTSGSDIAKLQATLTNEPALFVDPAQWKP